MFTHISDTVCVRYVLTLQTVVVKIIVSSCLIYKVLKVHYVVLGKEF